MCAGSKRLFPRADVVQRLSKNRRVARILTFESSLRNSAQRALTSQPEATPQEKSLTKTFALKGQYKDTDLGRRSSTVVDSLAPG